MLTIFSVPKPFTASTATYQGNAIESWRRMHPDVEIILFGNDSGVREAAKRFDTRHVPDLERNELGTPLLGSIFRCAESISQHEIIAYVNADIILLPDALAAVKHLQQAFRRFLLVGRRTDLDVDAVIEFSGSWEQDLRAAAVARGRLHRYYGSDFFIYRKPMLSEMPDFAIGRTIWDNWIMFHARDSQTALVDGTRDILCVHQNHDYAHIHSGGDAWRKGREAASNLLLAGGHGCVYTVYDATHVLKKGRLLSTRMPWFWLRHLRARTNRQLPRLLVRNPIIHKSLAEVKRRLVSITNKLSKSNRASVPR